MTTRSSIRVKADRRGEVMVLFHFQASEFEKSAVINKFEKIEDGFPVFKRTLSHRNVDS